MARFDAAIDLTSDRIPPNMPPEEAIERVRHAVQALHGAGWISVGWCSRSSPDRDWVRVFAIGSGEQRSDALGAAIKAFVGLTARRTLFTGPRALPHLEGDQPELPRTRAAEAISGAAP